MPRKPVETTAIDNEQFETTHHRLEDSFIRLGVLIERNKGGPVIKPASEITQQESVADIKAASRRVELAFEELNALIQREAIRAALMQGESA